MKKIMCASLLFYFGIAFSQYHDNDNVFNDKQETKVAEDDDGGFPGNPDGVPINQYIPFLIIFATSTIVYVKLKANSKNC